MKQVLETYFNIINDYWKQKGLTSILEKNKNIIDILNFYIKSEKLHIDMNKSGWTNGKVFIIALSDVKNNLVGCISISKNECILTHKNVIENILSVDNFIVNDGMNGYFSDSFNINGNNIEHITKFNEKGIILSNGSIPYLSHNIITRFSEAYSLHKTETKRLNQKKLIKVYQQN